ncbi:MAG: ferritin-like domain-containing protein [Acidobacteriota bacterium]|nr:ferritin-like domain-containing protein [Acidobacteriota bacterium]
MKIDTLETLLTEELRDLYDAEKQLVKALPKLAKASSSNDLRAAFTAHLEVTKGQVTRIERALELLGAKIKSKPCAAMRGLIEEGSETMREDMSDELMDVALIAAAQKVEHYEISGYGTCRAIAGKLGRKDVAALLLETENEEKAADRKLTEVTQSVLESAHMGAPAATKTAGRSR